MSTKYSNFTKSTRKTSGNTLRYDGFMGGISKDLHKQAKRAITMASTHVMKKLKEKTTQKFGAGSNITKGVGKKMLKTTGIVGIGPPAQAAHLIEFGTDPRYKESGGYTGYIVPDPFVIPTYVEEVPAVEKILSKEWF